MVGNYTSFGKYKDRMTALGSFVGLSDSYSKTRAVFTTLTILVTCLCCLVVVRNLYGLHFRCRGVQLKQYQLANGLLV